MLKWTELFTARLSGTVTPGDEILATVDYAGLLRVLPDIVPIFSEF